MAARASSARIQTEFSTKFDLEGPIKIQEDIKSVTYLKEHFADVFEQINQTQQPVVITQNGEPRAVIQDPRS